VKRNVKKGLVALITFTFVSRFTQKTLPLRLRQAPLTVPLCWLFREKPPADWLPKVLANLPAVLVDHAHLERKAATSALNLEKYRDLFPRVAS